MNIAICSDIYLPQLSGVADVIETLAQTLRARGHSVHILAPMLAGSDADPSVMRLPAYPLPGSGSSMLLVFPLGITRRLRRIRPDVIHVHTFSTTGLAALFAGRRLGIPVVATDHTSPADYLHYMHLDYAPMRYLIRRYAAWFHGRCASVTAPSQHILDELAAYGMREIPARVIPNPVRTSSFCPIPPAEREQVRKRLGLDKPAVLLFGRIAFEKNLRFAVRIFASLARNVDALLVVIGDGPYRAQLERDAAEAGIADKIRLLGVLRDRELVEALNACDVSLVTSTSEIQPMATLQAMACGLPVIAARAGGLPECVIDEVTGFTIDPADETGFANRLSALIAAPSLARELGARGRERVMAYSPETVAQMYEDTYGSTAL